jgi:DNA-binding protein HU-beta
LNQFSTVLLANLSKDDSSGDNSFLGRPVCGFAFVSLGEVTDMNKSELIAKVAADTRLTRGEAGEVVEATIENIIKALGDGDDVRLMGFGVFTVSRRKSGEARNPKTGKIIKMPASKRARFKPGKILKEAVNS